MSDSAEPIVRDKPTRHPEDQAGRQALVDRVLSRFEAQNPSREIVAFVRRLVQYCAKHGPRVDIRFRGTMRQTSPDVDARLRDDPHYTGPDMLPKQYFTGKEALAREERLGRRLQARLQEAFPRELVAFELGERIEEPRDVTEHLPHIEVPTLFIDHSTTLYGEGLGSQRKGKFVNVRMVFLASFRLPGESASLDHQIDIPNELTPTLIDISPSPRALYETLATGPHNAFAWHFPNWFLKGPSNETAEDAPPRTSPRSSAGAEPDEPFEPDPRYLDPTHDEPIRFSEVSPRCGPADAHCLPIPFNGDPELVVGSILKSRYKSTAKRTRVPEFAAAPGAEPCSHDGDCLTAGDGRCVRWDTELSDEFAPRGLPLFDAYCGCVELQCQWFTQPRPAIHLDFKPVKLDGWPKHLTVDQDELDLTRDFVFKQEVSLCLVDHLKQLPRRIVMRVEQRRDRSKQTGTITGAPAKVARCIERMFPSVSVSLRDVTDTELAQHPITLTATFVASVKTVP